YCYTPRGAVYVRGYWDYPLAQRGLLYAPVYWGSGYYNTARITYRPASAILVSGLLGSLYIHANYGYYYGEPGYYNRYRGFNPWCSAYTGYSNRSGYDPLLAYYAWSQGRNRVGWQNRLAESWGHGGPFNARGGITSRDQHDDMRHHGEGAFSQGGQGRLVRSLKNLDDNSRRELRVSRVDDRFVDRFREDARRAESFRDRRRAVERGPRVLSGSPNRTADFGRSGPRGGSRLDGMRDSRQGTIDRASRGGEPRSQFTQRNRESTPSQSGFPGSRSSDQVQRGFRGLDSFRGDSGLNRGATTGGRRATLDSNPQSRDIRPSFRPEVRQRWQTQGPGVNQSSDLLNRFRNAEPRRAAGGSGGVRTSFERPQSFVTPPASTQAPRGFQRSAQPENAASLLRRGPARDFRPQTRQSPQRMQAFGSQSQRGQRSIQQSAPARTQMPRPSFSRGASAGGRGQGSFNRGGPAGGNSAHGNRKRGR
ncbi:MAG: hypothetical protein KDA37_18450, partial [Planctomycetales bacterium]|nr:hypothetical protein [Planctomycetales bacterium]